MPITCTTIEVAGLLGMAVRSVQLMVDRGELEAWKTPGGHRRISRASVERWLASRQSGIRPGAEIGAAARRDTARRAPRVLLIEDSAHFQNLVRLLLAQKFPQVELHIADEGIAGLAMAGQLQPEVLLVDILLPGIDGATLITSLRSHAQFQHSRLIVITSLDEDQRSPTASRWPACRWCTSRSSWPNCRPCWRRRWRRGRSCRSAPRRP